MKIVKDWKPLGVSFLLSALMVGGVIYQFANNRILEFGRYKQAKERASAGIAEVKSGSAGQPAKREGAVNRDLPPQTDPAGAESASKPARKPQALPGLFRGDWGPEPVYAKDDRVIHERGAYLSLIENNQNQPPATSPGSWRLLKKFKAVREENCFTPAPGADMGECDFSAESARLKDLDLRKANLVKARLNGELGAADLRGANLSGAAVLGSLVISPDTRMTGTNLSYLQADGNNPVIAENANLSGVNFTKASLYGAKLSNADLSQSRFTEAVLTGSNFASANLSKADLDKADISYGNLAEAKLNQAILNETNLEEADLRHADAAQAKLRQANLANAQLAGVNFSGADLRGANLSGAHGADSALVDVQTNFTAAICPDGVTVDGTQVSTCVGHGF